ncbi:hypothetical protein FB451DRAFT_1185176 [Mycena latifolia]|nr:hypothetical protein FB451DRAFT_1185176 [Mycena latifolia]
MAANIAPILLFRPCPGSGALFATKMVRLASLFPSDFQWIFEYGICGVGDRCWAGPVQNRFEREPDRNERQVQVQGSETSCLEPNARFSVRAARGRSNPEPNSNLKNPTRVFPDRVVVIHREPAAAAWLTLAPVIAIAVEAYDELVHGV